MASVSGIQLILTRSMEVLRMSTAVLGVTVYTTGFIGNFLSLLLFIQSELRRVSTGLLFLILNIVSTIHLLSLIVEFLDTIFRVQLVRSDVFRCQFILWLQNASRTICSFIAMTVSIDRFLRSEYPIKSRMLCTTKNVIKLSTSYILFSSILYAFFFYPLNIFDADGNCSFSANATFRMIALNVMPPIRFILICILPSGLMLGCGGRMLYNIRQSRRRIMRQTSTQPTLAVATIQLPVPKASNTGGENQRQKVATDHMLLLMVIANVIAYIVTQTPFNIYAVYYGYETSDDFSAYSLTRAFLLMWSSIYFGTGFYLFCIASPQFRKQFLANMNTMWRCGRLQGQNTNTRRA